MSLAEEVIARRQALAGRNTPVDAEHRWGLALSGGGIRSATFCLGVLRALARNDLLLRFDMLSTVSGGGYIGSMLGRLFDRARNPAQVQRVQSAIGQGDAAWYLWWLRANGRYLIPRGAKDRTFAIALFLRNLVGVHFELGLVALLLGVMLAGVDMLGWWAVESLGYWRPTALNLLRWLPHWLSVVWLLVLPLVGLLGAAYAAAHWATPWVATSRRLKTVWVGVLLIDVLLFWVFHREGIRGTLGDDQREAMWLACTGLIAVWLLAVPISRRYLRKAALQLGLPDAVGAPPSRPDQAQLLRETTRSLLTQALARVFRVFAAVALLGLVDRVAWYFAFEHANLARVGLSLGIAAAVVRAALPLAATLGQAAKRPGLGLPFGHLLGYLLTFLLCSWWVSLVHKAALGAMFGNRAMNFGDGAVVLALMGVPLLSYVLLTGRHLGFLNASSLHSFYRARLSRSYLGATNPRRFGRPEPLGTLDTMPNTLPPNATGVSVDKVYADDDQALDHYRPQRAGGPVHILNSCINQTRDPRGKVFNQDRRGLPLAIASGGLMQVAREGWKRISGPGALTLGTWTAVSGAAVAPGLGASTRGGIAALATFAGLRLGYWWSHEERSGTAGAAPGGSRFAKSVGILSEAFGVFKGTEGRDWFLTDGGHFENTGAYALLAERTEVIVLADCGADPQYTFVNLENLVRKARIDLQADIRFQRPIAQPDLPQRASGGAEFGAASLLSTDALAKGLQVFGSLNELASPTGTACLALAKIEYHGERTGHGILILIKPNMCTGLPVDLVNFKAQNPDFPQQPTADQFFSESQWESYFQLGQSLADHLTVAFVQALAREPDLYFEEDDRAAAQAAANEAERSGKAAAAAKDNAAAWSRIPARIGATAVGTTIGLGAAATVGVSAWQAIDSTRAAYNKQTSDERGALKELTDLWAKVPPDASAPRAAERSAAYGNVAAALVRIADTLCPSNEAGWFTRSPLAGKIFLDTVAACEQMPRGTLPRACSLLVEARDPNLKGLLPNCLAVEDRVIQRTVPPVQYWGYDYSEKARWNSMHPCDPQRAALREAEDDHERRFGPLSIRQSAPWIDPRDADPDAKVCGGEAPPPAAPPPDASPEPPPYATAPPVFAPAPVAVAPAPEAAPVSGSAAGPASGSSGAGAVEAPFAKVTPPPPPASSASASGPAMPSIATLPAPRPADPRVARPTDAAPNADRRPEPPAGRTPPSNATNAGATSVGAANAALPGICMGVTVYLQIYGPAQRDEVRDFRRAWRQLGASVPPVEDVFESARRDGLPAPYPVRRTTVRYHDLDGLPCANQLAAAAGKADWIVEPLSTRLTPTARTVEVWVAPAAAAAAR